MSDIAGFLLAVVVGSLLVVIAIAMGQLLKEARKNRLTQARHMHMDIMRLALEDEDLREAWSAGLPSQDPIEQRQHIYVNLIVSHLSTRWETGEINEAHVRYAAQNILSGAPGERFWHAARQIRKDVASRSAEGRFIQTFDEEFSKLRKLQLSPNNRRGSQGVTSSSICRENSREP